MQERATLDQLLNTLPQSGRLEWIGVRPERGAPMIEVEAAQLNADAGIVGDRFKGRPGSARQVTLLQQEHLGVIAACLHRGSVAPSELRRNLLVSGINLLALKGKRFAIGDVMLEYSGQAHPCSKMERLLGPGAYNAMRGHGGITARVCTSGVIRCGDPVVYSGGHV